MFMSSRTQAFLFCKEDCLYLTKEHANHENVISIVLAF